MKKLFLLPFILFACGSNNAAVITGKYYLKDKRYCTFYYKGLIPGGDSFEDECSKYNIGDSLLINKKK